VDSDGVRDARDFAEVLEDHDLGSRIGAAVADRAIAEIARLNRNRTSKIALSINASAGELVRRSFLKRVGRHVSGRGPDAGPITVEINETVILDDPDGALAEEMRRAEKDGVTFSLDHFGTGGSSLLQITAWPISEVKVDRSFVAGLEADGDKQRVIRGIIEAARSLGLRLIVEGVETEEQVHCINALGGRFAQGFFYSRAVPADALERLLDRAQGSLGEAA
jgi:EAL domain-containing protein (putative c-di-GMP-specific phosphodiesterase class I)